MANKTRTAVAVLGGIAFLVLGVILLVFAVGLRRWYSGLFFILMGMVTLAKVFRGRRVPREWKSDER